MEHDGRHSRRTPDWTRTATWQLICRWTVSPWSWHLFGQLGPDGCPGFKGPFPQPVSMSVRSVGGAGSERQDEGLAATPACISVVACYYIGSCDEDPPWHYSQRQEAAAERSLYQAVLTLRTVEECRDFFRDLCTPAELQALTDRWNVVGLLQQGIPYREIHRLSGVSVTTIGRVSRYLAAGNGGYALAARRLSER